MNRPSKFRVLSAVNHWRITHGKAPILRLPKGDLRESRSCPLKHALGVDQASEFIWFGSDGLTSELTPPILAEFIQAFDAGLYPELIS